MQDTIRLENAVMPALAAGTLASTAFWKSTTGLAHDSNDRIIYETDTGWLNYDSNGSAAGGRFTSPSWPQTSRSPMRISS